MIVRSLKRDGQAGQSAEIILFPGDVVAVFPSSTPGKLPGPPIRARNVAYECGKGLVLTLPETSGDFVVIHAP